MGNNKTTVYFIQCTGPDGPTGVKIGHARDAEARIIDLQVGSPYPLKLIGRITVGNGPSVESHLHRLFRRAHIRGEWFAPIPEILDLAERCADHQLRSAFTPEPPLPREIRNLVILDVHDDEPASVEIPMPVNIEIQRIKAAGSPARRAPRFHTEPSQIVRHQSGVGEEQPANANAAPETRPFMWRGRIRF